MPPLRPFKHDFIPCQVIHHLGVGRPGLDEYNYHNSPRACPIEVKGNSTDPRTAVKTLVYIFCNRLTNQNKLAQGIVNLSSCFLTPDRDLSSLRF